MRRLLPIAVLVLAAVLAPSAAAYELTVLDPGSARLDLGTVSSPRLVHGTLTEPGDVLEIGLQLGEPLVAKLFVPDVRPERALTDAQLPAFVDPVDEPGVDETPVDAATGIRYRLVDELALEPAQYRQRALRVRIRRGREPVRFAVLVGDADAPFEATDPARTPRTLARLRAWVETPADGSAPAQPPRSGADRAWMAWTGATIALVALLTALWWVRAGRARSRTEGAARAAREAGSPET